MALDSKLDVTRTPFAKAQLRVALGFLDDANSSLRRNFEGDTASAVWIPIEFDVLRKNGENLTRQRVAAQTTSLKVAASGPRVLERGLFAGD
jgi:hypothetical protein